jgi:hypothetical protein
MSIVDQGIPRQLSRERPFFLISVDTEGDGIWWRPRAIETKNAAFLPRFQILCEKYGLTPTYLTNYEMAVSPVFRELGRDVLKRNAGEIGMHLHAWHSPPDYPLTERDDVHHPYLIEYPTEVMRSKIAYLTDLLEAAFGVKMVSHRSGRWSFSATYARLLLERGYRVDCSVTPYVSWRWKVGDPRRTGGTDFSDFPDCAYFLDAEDISRAGSSKLLEVPVTTMPPEPAVRSLVGSVLPSSRLMASAVNRLSPVRWLRPNGRNLKHLLRIVDRAVAAERRYIQCMLHSSELMPGGSPTFRTDASIETLYEHLERLFEHTTRFFDGATLAQFHDAFRDRTPR